MTIPLSWGVTGHNHILLVTGSRSWTDVDKINNYMDSLDAIIAKDDHCAERMLINGQADGADQITRSKAITLGWGPWDFDPLDHKLSGMTYGQACYARNLAMVQALTSLREHGDVVHSVAFWKGHSLGTGHTINMLVEYGHEPTIFYSCSCHPILSQSPRGTIGS